MFGKICQTKLNKKEKPTSFLKVTLTPKGAPLRTFKKIDDVCDRIKKSTVPCDQF